MNYRLATIMPVKTVDDSGTQIIDINLADPISQIVIKHDPVQGNPVAAIAHPCATITKIELLDGSDVLFSLNGHEALAAAFYHRHKEPIRIYWQLAGFSQNLTYFLNFGRYLYDPRFALDPKKFTNLQLKITYDEDAADTNGTTSTMAVLAHLFDDKVVEPEGFLMHKELKDYALAANTHEYTDLPTDYPYRKLFARIQKLGTGIEFCFNNIKLSEDNDKKVPLNHSITDVLYSIVANAPLYKEWIICEGIAAGTYIFNTPTYWPTFSATVWSDSISATDMAVYQGDGGRAIVYQDPAVRNVQVLCQGWCPHSVIEIPFGLQDDPDDWYDVTKLGSLVLDIQSAGSVDSGDNCQIFLQQLRKYA